MRWGENGGVGGKVEGFCVSFIVATYLMFKFLDVYVTCRGVEGARCNSVQHTIRVRSKGFGFFSCRVRVGGPSFWESNFLGGGWWVVGGGGYIPGNASWVFVVVFPYFFRDSLGSLTLPVYFTRMVAWSTFLDVDLFHSFVQCLCNAMFGSSG